MRWHAASTTRRGGTTVHQYEAEDGGLPDAGRKPPPRDLAAPWGRGGILSGAAGAGAGTPVPGTGAAGGGSTRGDWTGARQRSELVGQGHDGLVRCCAELLPYALFVVAGMLQRPRPVAGRDECAHETQGGPGTERIEPCQRLPALRGRRCRPSRDARAAAASSASAQPRASRERSSSIHWSNSGRSGRVKPSRKAPPYRAIASSVLSRASADTKSQRSLLKTAGLSRRLGTPAWTASSPRWRRMAWRV